MNAFEILCAKLTPLQDILIEFINHGQRQSSTFHFWQQYITDVQIALDYMAAEIFFKLESASSVLC